jgi:phosphomannomutase
VVRTPVGQAYISEAILEHAAAVGGEGNGGVAVPELQPSHDSAATVGLLLEHLARTGSTLSKLASALPALAVHKLALAVPPRLLFSALQEFREAVGEVAGARVDHSDGVKVVWPDGWVHVRASNTQSLVRVIAEAEDPARAQQLALWARERLRLVRAR